MSSTEKITKSVEIPSDMTYIKNVSKEILSHLQHRKIDESILFCVRLAVEEALRNSIVHGHHRKKELLIAVSYAIDNNKIEIEIKDKGRGFDLTRLPDPTLDENLTNEGGRGVFLMFKMMDRVTYNKKGNEVKMTKFFRH